jgi:hypothetical protein
VKPGFQKFAFKFNLYSYDTKKQVWSDAAVYTGLLELLTRPGCKRATKSVYEPRVVAALGGAVQPLNPADTFIARGKRLLSNLQTHKVNDKNGFNVCFHIRIVPLHLGNVYYACNDWTLVEPFVDILLGSSGSGGNNDFFGGGARGLPLWATRPTPGDVVATQAEVDESARFWLSCETTYAGAFALHQLAPVTEAVERMRGACPALLTRVEPLKKAAAERGQSGIAAVLKCIADVVRSPHPKHRAMGRICKENVFVITSASVPDRDYITTAAAKWSTDVDNVMAQREERFSAGRVEQHTRGSLLTLHRDDASTSSGSNGSGSTGSGPFDIGRVTAVGSTLVPTALRGFSTAPRWDSSPRASQTPGSGAGSRALTRETTLRTSARLCLRTRDTGGLR